MARLHEYQGKALLREMKVNLPEGRPARSPAEARAIAEELGGAVVVKAQAWTTSRAAQGGIRLVETPAQAEAAARDILGLTFKGFPVTEVLVEKKIAIGQEFYAGLIVDDAAGRPVVIFSSRGGSGIEEIAKAHPESVARTEINLRTGLRAFEARELIRRTGVSGEPLPKLANAVVALWKLARRYEARSAEINPLVITADGEVVAADCRVTIDDYAVFRHPELKIEIAREMGHPPTQREKIAYGVEMRDHRGTFYFAELHSGFGPGEGVVGFHGAGGGGSMMSMDALTAEGFKIANFTDTSGNPSSNKVYRAARIILSIPNLDGYFGSGSGVASQEQFHSAYGLAKAFLEVGLDIPAVIRLGGNSEDRAVKILETACRDLPGRIEGYKKDDTPRQCASRFRELVQEARSRPRKNIFRRQPFTPPRNGLVIPIADGTVHIDLDQCDEATNAVIAEVCKGVIEIRDGKPALVVSAEEAASGRFAGWIACEIECRMRARPAVFVDLPIPGLEELIEETARA
ncbi:MAG: acetate--CoA ligase family protein [Candidatus Sumerlaeia bacterium]|nr:acetate--CoA ligase family protein [Candidatus Sumerlaeia bacterium]